MDGRVKQTRMSSVCWFCMETSAAELSLKPKLSSQPSRCCVNKSLWRNERTLTSQYARDVMSNMKGACAFDRCLVLELASIWLLSDTVQLRCYKVEYRTTRACTGYMFSLIFTDDALWVMFAAPEMDPISRGSKIRVWPLSSKRNFRNTLTAIRVSKKENIFVSFQVNAT